MILLSCANSAFFVSWSGGFTEDEDTTFDSFEPRTLLADDFPIHEDRPLWERSLSQMRWAALPTWARHLWKHIELRPYGPGLGDIKICGLMGQDFFLFPCEALLTKSAQFAPKASWMPCTDAGEKTLMVTTWKLCPPKLALHICWTYLDILKHSLDNIQTCPSPIG